MLASDENPRWVDAETCSDYAKISGLKERKSKERR